MTPGGKSGPLPSLTDDMMDSSPLKSLTEDMILESKEVFALLDKDGDGHISTEDLQKFMTPLPPCKDVTSRELDDMMTEVDEYRSGSIGFVEFLTMMARKMKNVDPEEETRQAFASFDEDGNGFISSVELKEVLTKLGDTISEADADRLIRQVDSDGDGQINYTEFHQLVLLR